MTIVADAFSRQSAVFDAIEDENRILQWMRGRIRAHMLKQLALGSRILELNAGTGLDAVFFAQNGHTVHATDISEGMLAQLSLKARSLHLENKISWQQCSYTELHQVNGEKFDHVFSNFGGLNCIPELEAVTRQLPTLLKPGGKVTFVLMPPVTPWEMLLALKGNFKTAFRRFKKGGADSHLEGLYFKTYYFTPRKAIRSFRGDFKKIQLEGLASVSPPPYLEKFPVRFPGLYRFLTQMDSRLSHLWPFNRWADHYILTMEYKPTIFLCKTRPWNEGK